MTTIPDTGKLRQNCDFEASLGYRVRPYWVLNEMKLTEVERWRKMI
jgi:hypothetical protein